MQRALVSGAHGLVGSAACRRLLADGWTVAGIDNDMRKRFFGPAASTASIGDELRKHQNYEHHDIDIRHAHWVEQAFGSGVDLVIHAAAQPAHEYATANVREDWSVNVNGSLNLLETWKAKCPKAPFLHISTSKIFGDNPNSLPFIEEDTRWEINYRQTAAPSHLGYSWHGIAENFPIDNCLHSFYGCSKLAADVLAQEYGRYHGLPVGIFRPGCVTGSAHRGCELHGFLAHLSACVRQAKPYRIIGYRGLQVRCNVHADDLVEACLLYAANPRPGEVYNIGGRGLDCSVLEALEECQKRCGKEAIVTHVETPRVGDHRWWISDVQKLQQHYGWKPRRLLPDILDELCDQKGV